VNAALGDLAFDPAATPTLVDSVADALRETILSGGIGPGERLVEAELARELRVSRGPVREALALLGKEGIVISVPRHGKFVQGFTPRLIDELYSLRMLLEPFAVSRVIATLDDDGRQRLESAVAAIAQAVAADDARTLARYDIGFHHLLYELADHDLLMRAWQDNIAGKLQILLNVTTMTLSALADAERQHRLLLEPIVAGDEPLARARLEDHIAEAAGRARAGLSDKSRTRRVGS
jgi:DNA-binding GntR family transcriptional regulator